MFYFGCAAPHKTNTTLLKLSGRLRHFNNNITGRKRSLSAAFTAPISNPVRPKRHVARYRLLTNMRTRTYRRGRMSARRGRRRSRYARRGAMAKRVARLESTAEETKHIIISDSAITGSIAGFAGVNLSAGGTPNCRQIFLNGIVRGNRVKDRHGDKVVVTSMKLNLDFTFGTAVANQQWVWWGIYTLVNGTTEVIAPNVLLSKFGVNTPTEKTLPDINNKDNTTLIRWLKRGKYFHAAPTDATVEQYTAKIRLKKKIYCQYKNGDTGYVSDINRNAHYLIVWTACTDTTANGISINLEGHVFFHG